MTTNPLFQTDFYKVGHASMYPDNTTFAYNNMTARKSRINGVNTVVVAGLQYFLKEYVIKNWNENFFNRPFTKVKREYLRLMDATMGPGVVTATHLKKLHKLGYMPLEIKSLPEGSSVPIRTPMATIKCTVGHASWLGNYLETIWSATVWQPITSATIAREYRRIFDNYALETVGNIAFSQWQGHDFSFRGMSSFESACTSGFGHLIYFTGTDTIPAITFAEKYYNANVEKELVGGSVPASEHAVASFNIIFGTKDYKAALKEYIERTPSDRPRPIEAEIDPKLIKEYAFLKRYITKLFPKGVCSYVMDTYNMFAVVAEILPRLKPEIMARAGGFPVDKLVMRPDSFWTDPVDCLCGFDGYHAQMDKLTEREKEVVRKGLVESLWDIFGGTISEKGYKLLDSHIGCIYGDSITIERAKDICERLKNKGFASTNWVAGIGSFTYQYNTRDTLGLAVKATYGIVDGTPIEVYKDPVSDDGMKKSAKGLIRVDGENNNYTYTDCVPLEEESQGKLIPVFRNGYLLVDYSLAEIRQRASESI